MHKSPKTPGTQNMLTAFGSTVGQQTFDHILYPNNHIQLNSRPDSDKDDPLNMIDEQENERINDIVRVQRVDLVKLHQ